MRVLFAYRYGLLGGVSAQLFNRYPWFSQHLEVGILYEQDHGMVSRFPAGVARVTASAEDKVAAIKEFNPDVLAVIDSPAFMEAWTAAGSPGQLIVEVHTTTRNKTYLEALTADHGISAFVTVSEYMKASLQADGLEAVAPIHIVPNCLDLRWFDVPSVPRLREKPLLWVGKLDAHKRWRAALDVMDDALSRHTKDEVRPVLIGGYTAPQPEIDAFLRRYYASPTLKRGHWWPYVDYARMPSVFRAAAQAGGGLLMTTTNESFGMAAAEALMMGCPVVAPDVGALPELISRDALYEPGDWDGARARVTRMLNDARFRRRIVNETRGQVRDLVHPERAVSAFLAALNTLDRAAAPAPVA